MTGRVHGPIRDSIFVGVTALKLTTGTVRFSLSSQSRNRLGRVDGLVAKRVVLQATEDSELPQQLARHHKKPDTPASLNCHPLVLPCASKMSYPFFLPIDHFYLQLKDASGEAHSYVSH